MLRQCSAELIGIDHAIIEEIDASEHRHDLILVHDDGIHEEEVLQILHVQLPLGLRVNLLEAQLRSKIIALQQLLFDEVEFQREFDLSIDQFRQGILTSLIEFEVGLLQGHLLPQIRSS